MRTRLYPACAAIVGLALISAAPSIFAFSSGSTGADGALEPTVDTVVQLPASGILNYASINIPADVKVTFRKNVTNTPVTLLVSGDATVSGTIDVRGGNAAPTGTSGDGVIADDGNPGEAGPGGYGGGRGGKPGAIDSLDRSGGKGFGPGGGVGGLRCFVSNRDYDSENGGYYDYPAAGAGAGFGAIGGTGNAGSSSCPSYKSSPTYGSAELLPLIGGSGGGGGRAGPIWFGSGGGAGGGAILIAVSGTLTITNTTGKILANGGAAGNVATACAIANDRTSAGGGGSGGAIRLVATTLTGNGPLSATGGGGGVSGCGYNGGAGGVGRIRVEAETITRTTATSTPPYTFAQPGPVFIAGSPTLRITSVAGVDVPNPPTGVADVKLPSDTANPVTVAFATTGIPVGNTVKLSVAPASGAEVSAVSTALTGSTANATATAEIQLPTGASTLQATITYTVIVAVGDALSPFAEGERVERISITAGLDGKSTTKLITVSGKEFAATPEALRIAAFGG